MFRLSQSALRQLSLTMSIPNTIVREITALMSCNVSSSYTFRVSLWLPDASCVVGHAFPRSCVRWVARRIALPLLYGCVQRGCAHGAGALGHRLVGFIGGSAR